ncbi:ABC transporter permease [Leucobacter komagatae]|uniref:ABC transporter permease n=1 Tax=Leucobacter komagatae TaxID=55969 RepID=A0A0D0IRN6_9MICO|nr:ABC transporter permease [Leucobacter komagatae]KIP52108.1 ABC transporter permease [Leucobacter komagatae]
MLQTLRWSAGRVASSLLTLLGVSILIFAAMRLMPGSIEDILLGPLASPEQKAQLAAEYGLDQPIMVQYLAWIGKVLQGDLGISVASKAPVLTEIAQRIPLTALLSGLALLFTLLIGIPLGIWAGVRSSGTKAGAFGRLISGLGISLPEFVLGTVVLFVVSRLTVGLQVGGFSDIGMSFGSTLSALLLPAMVLSVFTIAATARTTRDAVLNVLVEPHIGAAVARGESPRHIIRHHILRNAGVPILTLLATITAYLLGGSVIVEWIFNLPGLGSYMVQGLGRRDFAVVQATVLFNAALFITVSLVLDLVTSTIDPRVKFRGKASA